MLISFAKQKYHQHVIHSCWIILFALFITGCQSLFKTTTTDNPKRQYLINWLPLNGVIKKQNDQPLPNPQIISPLYTDAFAATNSFTHIITTENNKQPPLIIKGQIKSDRLVMVGLNDIGLPLFDITLQQQKLSFNQRAPITMPIPPEWLLESFQLMFWPLTAIEAQLIPHCTIKEVIKNQRVSSRTLGCDNQETIKIEYLFEKRRLSSVKYTPSHSPVEVQVSIIQ